MAQKLMAEDEADRQRLQEHEEKLEAERQAVLEKEREEVRALPLCGARPATPSESYVLCRPDRGHGRGLHCGAFWHIIGTGSWHTMRPLPPFQGVKAALASSGTTVPPSHTQNDFPPG